MINKIAKTGIVTIYELQIICCNNFERIDLFVMI